jgi:hypothetical protein
MFSIRLLLLAAALAASRTVLGAPCTPVPLYEAGIVVSLVCAEAPGPRRVLLDLRDDWTPRIFSETPEQPQSYRETFIALANERLGRGRDWARARSDRHFELFGIFPTFSLLGRRLLDTDRHACHAAVDDSVLRPPSDVSGPSDAARSRAQNGLQRAMIAAVQAHLKCERLLPSGARNGVLDDATQSALGVYQRLHMLPSLAGIDASTRDTLLTPSRELDLRALLRSLRERVVGATGLIEDGSARNDWEPILGRYIDAADYRRVLRSEPLDSGAPDLIDRATQAAALALGWTSPDAAAAALATAPPVQLAIEVPSLPDYYSTEPLDLHVEIDRADAPALPLDRARRALPAAARPRPTLTVFVRTPAGDVALVRWPTTVGGWKQEKLADGSEERRYKRSPTGQFVWRDLVVAPSWFPPASTPDRELMQQRPDGRWVPDRDALGPGYASAYGLVALFHHRAVAVRSAPPALVDVNVRTHGSGNYRSILRGSSHGCHRLFNHLAIRLGSFLLAHRETVRDGLIAERFTRQLESDEEVFHLQTRSRGYRFELVPPVSVEVLPRRSTVSPALPHGGGHISARW